jgi:hypothetical protein
MKNVIAAFLGIITSFLFYFIFLLLLIKMNYGGFGEFATGTIEETQVFNVAEKSMFISGWIILPISVIIAAIVSAVIAKTNEYLIGFICAIPIIVFSIYTGSYYQSVVILMSFLGVGIVRHFKRA